VYIGEHNRRDSKKQSLRVCIWFQDATHYGSASTVRVLPLPPPLPQWLILDFSACLFKNFTLVAPHFVGQHDSRSNFWIWPSPGTLVPQRVPGLPMRDCARGYNNRAHTRPQMSAINVTEKTFFERLYLVLGLCKFAPWVNCPYAPTTPAIHCTTISRFLCIFFQTKKKKSFNKFNRHLCHGAYWCTHNPAHIPILFFHLCLRFSNIWTNK